MVVGCEEGVQPAGDLGRGGCEREEEDEEEDDEGRRDGGHRR